MEIERELIVEDLQTIHELIIKALDDTHAGLRPDIDIILDACYRLNDVVESSTL